MCLIKTSDQINKIRESSRIVALVHKKLREIIKPGISLLELDKYAEEIIREEGGTPIFKKINNFPNSICTSVNNEMVHGIPRPYLLNEGDIISIDVGVNKDGWNGDAAFTMGVGNISKNAQKIIDITRKALLFAIKFAKSGISLGQLGEYIESFALKNGYTAAKDFGGHGIGKKLHEEPFIQNIKSKNDFILKENMTICIEPMFIDGPDCLFIDPIDKWTVRTKHGGLTTHYEHTIVIRKNGGEILTKL